MSLEHHGFIGLFAEPLGRQRIQELVLLWLERFGNIEQTIGNSHQALTQAVRSASDLVWEKDLQFRVLTGEQFAWVYITLDRPIIETSGLAPDNGSYLCRDVLTNIHGCLEIIDEHNDRRLNELEAKGLI